MFRLDMCDRSSLTSMSNQALNSIAPRLSIYLSISGFEFNRASLQRRAPALPPPAREGEVEQRFLHMPRVQHLVPHVRRAAARAMVVSDGRIFAVSSCVLSMVGLFLLLY